MDGHNISNLPISELSREPLDLWEKTLLGVKRKKGSPPLAFGSLWHQT